MGYIKDNYTRTEHRDFFAMGIGALVVAVVCSVTVLIATKGDHPNVPVAIGSFGAFVSAVFFIFGFRRWGR